jgi:hypothetical protein
MHHDYLITPQHTLHQIAQGTPEILAATGQSMLINEQHVVFEASVEMRLETQLNYDRVVVSEGNVLGKGTPMRDGNMDSLSTLDCTQAIRCSIYCGAGILVGFL